MTRYLDEPSRKDLRRKRDAARRTAANTSARIDGREQENLYEDRLPRKPHKKKKKKKRSRFSKKISKRMKRFRKHTKGKIFWWLFLVYVLILFGLGFIFLMYTDKCLEEYEASQSTHYMDVLVQNISASLQEGRIPDGIDLSSSVNAFDDASTVTNAFLSSASGGPIRYEKAANSYDTENPEYVIYAGDNSLINVKLSGTNPRTIFGILTIMDWDIASETVACIQKGNDVVIKIPEGFSATINGIPVGSEYLSGESANIELFQYAAEYCELPDIREYVIPGMLSQPSVQIFDNNGEAIDYECDGNTYTAFYRGADTVPEPYYSDALNMAKTWSLFMSKDLSGESYGVDKLCQYLIKDSYYYTMAREYARSIDITFISAHTLANDTFTNVVLDDFVQYNEDCYSCHIYFEKNMILKTGRDMTDLTNSTFIFVNYDDTDDGVDNKHWCIADMIASTDNAE